MLSNNDIFQEDLTLESSSFTMLLESASYGLESITVEEQLANDTLSQAAQIINEAAQIINEADQIINPDLQTNNLAPVTTNSIADTFGSEDVSLAPVAANSFSDPFAGADFSFLETGDLSFLEAGNLIIDSDLLNINTIDLDSFSDIEFSVTDLDGFDQFLDNVSFAGVENDALMFEFFDLNGDIITVESNFNTVDFAVVDNPESIAFSFDTDFYLANNLDVFNAGENPFTHFMTTGWREGRDPSQYFDTSFYLLDNPDVLNADINPLVHFNASGWLEFRDPSPLFDTSFYFEANPDVFSAQVNPLNHYATTGWTEGRDPSEFFDTEFYLQGNLDVANANINPLEHFVISGGFEGRDPSLFFDSDYYLALYPDVAVSGLNPLEHFSLSGADEGRITDEIFAFDSQAIIAQEILSVDTVQKLQILVADSSGRIPSFDDLSPIQQSEVETIIATEANFELAQTFGIFGGSDSCTETGCRGPIRDFFRALRLGGDLINLVIKAGFESDLGVKYAEFLYYSTGVLSESSTIFPLPSEQQIEFEFFPKNNESEVTNTFIFPLPVDNVFEGNGVLTFPSAGGTLEDIPDGIFVFPDGDSLEGTYFLSSEGQLIRGLEPFGSLGDPDLTNYERTIGQQLLDEGNQLIGVDDDNVRKVFGIPKNEGLFADYLSLSPSGRFNLTEVKGSSADSTRGAEIGKAIEQLTNTYNTLIQRVPGAKLGKVEIAVPEGAPLEPPYQLSGDQIIRVTDSGTEVLRVGESVVRIRR